MLALDGWEGQFNLLECVCATNSPRQGVSPQNLRFSLTVCGEEAGMGLILDSQPFSYDTEAYVLTSRSDPLPHNRSPTLRTGEGAQLT